MLIIGLTGQVGAYLARLLLAALPPSPGLKGSVLEAMWIMIQHSTADDFVIASGVSHNLEELLRLPLPRFGLIGVRTLTMTVRSSG